MLSPILFFAYFALVQPPDASPKNNSEETDKSIMRVLGLATEQYSTDKEFAKDDCTSPDKVKADLAARAASMMEERAIRTMKLVPYQPERDRDSVRDASADLFLGAATFWVRANTCRPSMTFYLDHAELPLVTAEQLAPENVELNARRQALQERIIRQRVTTYQEQRQSESYPLGEPCSVLDGAAAQAKARRAEQMEEQAQAARALATRVTDTAGNTDNLATTLYREAENLSEQSALAWLSAWRCHPQPIYLDNADRIVRNPWDARRVRDVARHRAESVFNRLSVRLDFGYGAGRLARAASKASQGFTKNRYRGHHGGYMSVSLMLRVPTKREVASLLIGPYFTYWRANERSDIPETKSAKVSETGAKIEASFGFTPRAARIFTLHPGLEFGMQRVDFDGWNTYTGSNPEDPAPLVDPEYVDMTGGSLGLSLGACFAHASACTMFRVHGVPQVWKNAVPTVMIGVGIDVARMTYALLRRANCRGNKC